MARKNWVFFARILPLPPRPKVTGQAGENGFCRFLTLWFIHLYQFWIFYHFGILVKNFNFMIYHFIRVTIAKELFWLFNFEYFLFIKPLKTCSLQPPRPRSDSEAVCRLCAWAPYVRPAQCPLSWVQILDFSWTKPPCVSLIHTEMHVFRISLACAWEAPCDLVSTFYAFVERESVHDLEFFVPLRFFYLSLFLLVATKWEVSLCHHSRFPPHKSSAFLPPSFSPPPPLNLNVLSLAPNGRLAEGVGGGAINMTNSPKTIQVCVPFNGHLLAVG